MCGWETEVQTHLDVSYQSVNMNSQTVNLMKTAFYLVTKPTCGTYRAVSTRPQWYDDDYIISSVGSSVLVSRSIPFNSVYKSDLLLPQLQSFIIVFLTLRKES